MILRLLRCIDLRARTGRADPAGGDLSFAIKPFGGRGQWLILESLSVRITQNTDARFTLYAGAGEEALDSARRLAFTPRGQDAIAEFFQEIRIGAEEALLLRWNDVEAVAPGDPGRRAAIRMQARLEEEISDPLASSAEAGASPRLARESHGWG